MSSKATITVHPPAKINLFLEMLGKRPDGYHEIKTIMAPLELCDEITFEPAAELSLSCDHPHIPTDERNLVIQAARLLQEATGCRSGARILLTKRIPSEAGLGGGSSDAAFTLLTLNQLWGTEVSQAGLAGLAQKLGSDVPYFLTARPALCSGRGEAIETIESQLRIPVVLICPQAGLRTAQVYAQVVVPQKPRGDTEPRQALERNDGESLGAWLFNRLESPAMKLLPVIARLKEVCDTPECRTHLWGHQMSGSGSSYFCLCRSETDAQQFARLIETHWEQRQKESSGHIRILQTRMVSEFEGFPNPEMERRNRMA